MDEAVLAIKMDEAVLAIKMDEAVLAIKMDEAVLAIKMDEAVFAIAEKLFSKSIDQKTVRILRKDIEKLPPASQALLISEVLQRLRQQLQDDPISALSSVCLFSDGCKVLQQCLSGCVSEILSYCNSGLRTDLMKSELSRYQLSSKAVYGALQSISTQSQTFFENSVVNSQLKQLFELLVYAITDENLPFDCALIIATSLCLAFTFLTKDNVAVKFFHMLNIIGRYEKDGDKEAMQASVEDLYEREWKGETYFNYNDMRISYPLVWAIYGLLNSGVSWIYSVNCCDLEIPSNVTLHGKNVSGCKFENQEGPSRENSESTSASVKAEVRETSPSLGSDEGIQKIGKAHEGTEVFLYRLYPLINKSCRSASSYSFQSFQVLLSWLQSVRKMMRKHQNQSGHLARCHMYIAPSKIELFAIHSDFSDNVFHLMNSNWESPSKGVSDTVYTCMWELLQIHENESPGQAKTIAMHMISTLVSANAWNLKSTYPPLALAISYAGAEVVLQKYPSLPECLLQSLPVNYLAPAGTNVYKIILSQLRSSTWSKYFLSLIVKALHSFDRLSRQSVLTLWLPITIRQYPDIYVDLLNNCLQSSSEGWLARMAILKVARSCSNVDIMENVKLDLSVEAKSEDPGDCNAGDRRSMPVLSIIHYATNHIDETVRSEALAFLCNTKKSSQPVTPEEVTLLKEFFSLNMNIDSSPFRQTVIQCYKALVLRLRDACATVLKTPPYKTVFNKDNVPPCALKDLKTDSVLFVNGELLVWFLLRFHFNLKPGGNYQRRILSLQLYKETLLAFFETGKGSEYIFNKRFQPVCSFMNCLSENCVSCSETDIISQPVLDLTLPWTSELLLSCCLDEMNDVRDETESVLRILEFSRVKPNRNEIAKWLRQGLTLCNSPKASDVESGASIIKTVACSSDFDMTALSKETEIRGSPKNFVYFLFDRVETQFRAAQKNLLIAARKAPIHGSLLALGRCLCESHSKTPVPSGDIQELLKRLLELMVEMVEYVLSVLAVSSKNGSAIAPSFAEMGESIEMTIKKCEEESMKGRRRVTEEEGDPTSSESLGRVFDKSDNEIDECYEAETAISTEHALVLASCWQTMKVCCFVSSMCASHWLNVLSENQVEMILRSIVIRVLTGTRHKGAMEAARTCYSQLSNLLLSSNSNFAHLICSQIDDVLNQLKSGAQTSITRRAAGVAMMVQVACGAVPRTSKLLIDSTVTRLMDIIQTDYEEQSTVDSPPVLALHILHSLVIHASLAHRLIQHMPDITVICLKAFASNSWALRNAALQLYGAVVPRMVGQKKVRDDSSTLNSRTASEFLSRHSELADYLLKLLQDVKDTKESLEKDRGNDYEVKDNEFSNVISSNQQDLSLKTYSHLVPVLSLLARLSPGTGLQQSQELNERLCQYYNVTLHLLGSPIHTVRRLTAISLVALIPCERASEMINTIVDSLRGRKLTANELHGKLLTILEFFYAYPEFLCDYVMKGHLTPVLMWILESANTCFISAILALKILKLYSVRDLKLDLSCIDTSKPGAAQFVQSYIKLQIKQFSDDELEHFLMENVFSNPSAEEYFLNFLEDHLNGCRSSAWMEKTEEVIWQKLENSENLQLTSLVRILCIILNKQSEIRIIPKEKCIKNLLLLLKGHHGAKIASKTLTVIAFVIKEMYSENWAELSNKSEIISEFSAVISTYANPSSTEDYRLAAGTALRISITSLFPSCEDIVVTHKEQLIIAIIELLQDEDSEIRECASLIIFQLQKKNLLPNLTSLNARSCDLGSQMSEVVHPNLALKYFIEIIAKTSIYQKDWTTLQVLWRSSYLGCVYGHKLKLSLFQSQAINLYKEPKYCSLYIAETIEATMKEYVRERKTNSGVFTAEQVITEWLHQECEVMNKHGSVVKTLINERRNLLTSRRILTVVFMYVTAYRSLTNISNILNIPSELSCPYFGNIHNIQSELSCPYFGNIGNFMN